MNERSVIGAQRVGSQGWQGEYEPLAKPAGAVALLPSLSSEAAAAPSLRAALHDRGFSTLYIESSAVTDFRTLTPGLVEALDWLRDSGSGAPVGVFGSGLGACAALSAAALRPALVEALVAQGAWPELVLAELPRVRAASLLVIGDNDAALLQSHRRALSLLGGARRLEIVPGAGACDAVTAQAIAHLAAHWFAQRLPMRPLH